MAKNNGDQLTWVHDPKDVIVLVNRSRNNYVLELPTGLCRLDVGRKLRTLRSILKIAQVQKLVDAGSLAIE
ncbi:MAG: hypothetical protein KJZ86_27510 [Caldilineaceae bacterium]|nr:hypothetical protein [Caldilineaceae bacterium]HRJ42623.1 hypothetical protein [Caldilineaceae bacterium]